MPFLRGSSAGPLVSDEQRNRRLKKESVSRATQQPLAHAGMAISTHDKKVGFQASGLGDQSGADIVVAHPGAMQRGIDPVMLEVCLTASTPSVALSSIGRSSSKTRTVTSFAFCKYGS